MAREQLPEVKFEADAGQQEMSCHDTAGYTIEMLQAETFFS